MRHNTNKALMQAFIFGKLTKITNLRANWQNLWH